MIVFPKGLTDKGTTPIHLMEKLERCFNFTLDPCPKDYDGSFDGLKINWSERNYVNPPYSDKYSWIKKAIEEQKLGKLSVFFLPVDTSTKWFHEGLLTNAFIIWIKGRVKSDIGKTPAFSSLLAVFYPYKSKTGFASWNQITDLTEIVGNISEIKLQ